MPSGGGWCIFFLTFKQSCDLCNIARQAFILVHYSMAVVNLERHMRGIGHLCSSPGAPPLLIQAI